MSVKVTEREWTDRFGTHYEVRAIDKFGRIHSQVITRQAWGWSGRDGVYERVKASAETAGPPHS